MGIDVKVDAGAGTFKGEKELYERRYAARMEAILTEWNVIKHQGSNHRHGLMAWTAFKEMRMKAFDEIDKKHDRDSKWL